MFVFGTADDVFAMAVRIEENGKTFYSGAAEMATDPAAKTLFSDLSAMEAGHVEAFKSLRSTLPDSDLSNIVWDPEGLAESYLQATADTHIFTVEVAQSRLEKIKTPAEVLDMAIQFEKDSVAFFVGMKELLPDPAGKGEVDKLIRAEMEHITMLANASKAFAESGVAGIA
jgi:rubrerythrin